MLLGLCFFCREIKEKSHYCLQKYLEETFVKNGTLSSDDLSLFDLLRGLRQEVQYNVVKVEFEEDLDVLYNKAKNFIERHYKSNISIDDIANIVRLTPNYFSILFKQDTGINVSEYLIKIRLKKAKELLDNTKLIIKEISEKVGYTDPYYFSRTFKKFE